MLPRKREGEACMAVMMHPPKASRVESLGSHIAKLAWNPDSWDVVVVCAGVEFKVIRHILSRVPFFAAALASGFREGDMARIDIGDASVAAFRAVWHFLYTDDLARFAELRKPAELLDVLSLADRFELPAVAQACGQRLSALVRDLPATVVLSVIRAAKLHELRGLRSACHDRISESGGNFLLENGVHEFLSADGELYRDVVSATMKRRRTI